MKRGVIIFVVFLSIIFSFYSISAVSNYCVPGDYNWSMPSASSVCDYGVSLVGFTYNSNCVFNYGVPSSQCTALYLKQQSTLNCLFALSNNSYYFPVQGCGGQVKVSTGTNNFLINGASCYVVDAAMARNPNGQTCSFDGNTVFGNTYHAGWTVNVTCNGVNNRYAWQSEHTNFNITSKALTPEPYRGYQVMMNYNRSQFFNFFCPPNFCIDCTIPANIPGGSVSIASQNSFAFNLTEPVYSASNAGVKISSRQTNCNGTINNSYTKSNYLIFDATSKTFSFSLPLVPFSTQLFNLFILDKSGATCSNPVVVTGFNVTGKCGPGCVKTCYEDRDNDTYTSGNTEIKPTSSPCSTNYYEESHFDDLDNIDCNDNNINAWQNVDNLGIINASFPNYTLPNSCQTRCVGLNLNDSYKNESNNYIFTDCNPEPPLTCPAIPVCTLGAKQCSGTVGYQTCFSNSTGCAQWNSTIVNCDSGLTCGGIGDCRSFGVNVLANISKPLSNAQASKTINFSLLTSSVVDCELGNCPAGKVCIVYGGLNCSYVHFPSNITTNPGYNLTIFWNITNLDLNVMTSIDSGDWNRNFSQVVNFSRYFNSFAHYIATATLVYSSGNYRVNGTSPIVYFDTTTDWSCSRTSSTAWWTNPNPLSPNISVTNTNCALHLAEAGTSCCPLDNNVCRDNGECRGSANYCSELNTSASCNSASSIIVKNSVNSVFGNYNTCTRTWYVNNDCIGYNNCGCFWNSTSSTCSVGYQPTQRCSGVNAVLGECQFKTSIEDNCNTTSNVIKVSSLATLVNYTSITDSTSFKQSFADCIDYNRVYACPSTAKLPFFGFFEAMIALLIIFGIYIVKKHL